jgi:hypothetical protein
MIDFGNIDIGPVTGLTRGKHKFWAAHESFTASLGAVMHRLTSPGIWGLGLLAKSWTYLVKNDD